jgi:hypothetical protein
LEGQYVSNWRLTDFMSHSLSHHKELAQSLKEQISSAGGKVSIVQANITRSDDIEQLSNYTKVLRLPGYLVNASL